jgi:hypothetical protein
MQRTLKEYSIKLINNILPAASQEAVKKMIDESMHALEQSSVNDEMRLNFVDNMVNELDQFSPMNKDAQQWSNIQLSKIIFHRIRHQFTTTVD